MLHKIITIALVAWAVICLVCGLYATLTITITAGIAHYVGAAILLVIARANYYDEY